MPAAGYQGALCHLHLPRRGTRVSCAKSPWAAGQWSFYDPVPDPERRETGRSLLKALQSDSSEPPLVRLGVVRLPPSWAALEAALSASPDRLKRTLRLHLSPRRAVAPDVQGAAHQGCWLANARWAWRFQCRRLSRGLGRAFEAVPVGSTRAGLAPVQLTRFDLWHAHLVYSSETGALGLVMHAKEYPQFDPECFPVCLGRCQRGSDVLYDPVGMAQRTFLLSRAPTDGAGRLACLDLSDPAWLRRLVHPDLAPLATTDERDFGTPLATILYLKHSQRKPGRVLVEPLGLP